MTVALSDVVLLRNHLLSMPGYSDSKRVRQAINAWYWDRKPLASTVNILSFALYDLFGAEGAFSRVILSSLCLKSRVSRPTPRSPANGLLQVLRTWGRMRQRARLPPCRHRQVPSPPFQPLLRRRLLLHLLPLHQTTPHCPLRFFLQGCLVNTASLELPRSLDRECTGVPHSVCGVWPAFVGGAAVVVAFGCEEKEQSIVLWDYACGVRDWVHLCCIFKNTVVAGRVLPNTVTCDRGP